MIIITNDGRELYPILFGSYKTPEYSETILCIDPDDMEAENPMKIKIHLSEVKAIKGTYSFPLYYAKQTTNKADDAGTDPAATT